MLRRSRRVRHRLLMFYLIPSYRRNQVSNPNPFEQAALPFAVFVVKAIQSLIAGLNPNPVVAAGQIPGAFQVLLGQIEMQFPSLAASEFGAAQSALNSQLAGILAKLQAQQTAAPATPPA